MFDSRTELRTPPFMCVYYTGPNVPCARVAGQLRVVRYRGVLGERGSSRWSGGVGGDVRGLADGRTRWALAGVVWYRNTRTIFFIYLPPIDEREELPPCLSSCMLGNPTIPSS